MSGPSNFQLESLSPELPTAMASPLPSTDGAVSHSHDTYIEQFAAFLNEAHEELQEPASPNSFRATPWP